MGEVWMRTADWRSIITNMSAAHDPGKSDDLKQLLVCYQSMLRRGLARDTRDALFETHCGSCGLARGARHAVSTEHGLLSTHHPTAPVMKVCTPPPPVLALNLLREVVTCPLATFLAMCMC